MPGVSFIDAVPNHVSVEEHRTLTGATPASFSDIPPVLRQKVDNVRLTFDPPLDGFSPERDGALGTLYIIERFISPSFLSRSTRHKTLILMMMPS
jgi:nucleotide-sensitive chloride channel 1A